MSFAQIKPQTIELRINGVLVDTIPTYSAGKASFRRLYNILTNAEPKIGCPDIANITMGLGGTNYDVLSFVASINKRGKKVSDIKSLGGEERVEKYLGSAMQATVGKNSEVVEAILKEVAGELFG